MLLDFLVEIGINPTQGFNVLLLLSFIFFAYGVAGPGDIFRLFAVNAVCILIWYYGNSWVFPLMIMCLIIGMVKGAKA